MLLDAPSLVKLQPGTIRYRYLADGVPIDENRVEKPHEGQTDLHKKGGYFYHARLKDYSKLSHSFMTFCRKTIGKVNVVSFNVESYVSVIHTGDDQKEDSWKFCYVYKGANKARQKQVYYVFGKGLKTNDKGSVTYYDIDHGYGNRWPQHYFISVNSYDILSKF